MSDISAPDHATETPDSQALVWFVRMNSGDATDAEHDEFGFWLRDDPDNLMAYQRLETLWRDLNDVPDPRPAAPSSGPVISRRGLLVGAAGAAACAGLVAVTGLTIEDVTALGAADYRTGTGERRTVVLNDGSAVQLDAETAISVEGRPCVRLRCWPVGQVSTWCLIRISRLMWFVPAERCALSGPPSRSKNGPKTRLSRLKITRLRSVSAGPVTGSISFV